MKRHPAARDAAGRRELDVSGQKKMPPSEPDGMFLWM